MKKILLSSFTIVGFFFYIMLSGKSSTLSSVATEPVTTPITPPPVKDTTSTPTQTQISTTKSTATPPPKPQGMYRDGTYVGNSVDAYYGYIQVKAIIQDGKLANVIFLNYPKDRETSISISNYAMPILTSEAISAQNSNVDTVSGASDSSSAFRDSLASALAQAKN